MTNALIFGGSGKVARHLTRLLVAKGHTVHSVIRNPDQSATLEFLGAKPVLRSIEKSSVADLVDVIRETNTNVVIWSAGAGGGNPARTIALDRDGAIRSMDAAAEAGVKRYIMVSAIDVRDRELRPVPEWYTEEDKSNSDRMWDGLGTYMAAKLGADRELRAGNSKRDLDYTIVRPGRLSQDSGKGTIRAGKINFGGDISREDVAATIVACMENDGTIGLAFDILGGDTPIDAAVAKIAEERIDTFEGFH